MSSLLYTNTPTFSTFHSNGVAVNTTTTTTTTTGSVAMNPSFNYTTTGSPNMMDSFETRANESSFINEYLIRTSFHSLFLKFRGLISENIDQGNEPQLIIELQTILNACDVTLVEFVKILNILLGFYRGFNSYLNQTGTGGKFSLKVLIVYLLHKFVRNLDQTSPIKSNANHHFNYHHAHTHQQNPQNTVFNVIKDRIVDLDSFVLRFIKISEEELRWQNQAVLQKFKNLLYQNFQVI
ncbi:hypothetical protein WICPIJ_004482 [Wickerhamomyces pijperi]|uniref:Uncharacterized protein n=1 Tax=Wickerhamomyces pijperi TaxID=599730 RepID=A0A9P8TMV5_WICPI|nr:hypothetical protein WICPIJ_004482 [Wickerhamomyces pijperi]